MFTPTYAIPLNKVAASAHRIVIQGAPGTGKTTACLTFPNLTVIDIDKKLDGHRHRNDVNVLPFYDSKWVNETLGRSVNPAWGGFGSGQNYRMHDAVLKYVQTEGRHFLPEQNLLIDSGSLLDSALNVYYDTNPITSKGSKDREASDDKRATWQARRIFWDTLAASLLQLNCGVIITFHEAYPQDADGKILGKILPAVQGSFKEVIQGRFSGWFRQVTIADIKDPLKTQYMWQVKPDSTCNAGSTYPKLMNDPRVFVPAHYNSLV
jgi:AAA domain